MGARVNPLRQQIVNEARSYVGVRYRHDGRSREYGIDCLGLLYRVGEALEFAGCAEASDAEPWPHMLEGKILKSICDRMFRTIAPRQVQPGDILLFAEGFRPSHVAIVAELQGRRTMIHAWYPARKVVENSIDQQWQNKIVACYRYPEVIE